MIRRVARFEIEDRGETQTHTLYLGPGMAMGGCFVSAICMLATWIALSVIAPRLQAARQARPQG